MHHAVTVDSYVGWSGRGKLLIPVDLRYNKISELLKRMTEVVFDICAKIHEMDIRVKKSILHTWDIKYRSCELGGRSFCICPRVSYNLEKEA
jgi:hypothetical protein